MRISDWSSDVCSSDLVITDHHLPGDTLPDALAIVNPNQPGCGFPSKNLAGVGVIFYMMLALRAELRRRGVYPAAGGPRQIGRASCGERVCRYVSISVAAAALKNKLEILTSKH